MTGLANLAISAVATAPAPAASGTTLTVMAGHGARFLDPATSGPFPIAVWPSATPPDPSIIEIATCTARSGDVLTVARAQEGTSARAIVAGDQVAAGLTAEMWNVVSAAVARLQASVGPICYLDAYNDFFGGYPFVAGQPTTATTAAAEATVGAAAITVADPTGYAANALVVTGAGTASQQIYRVTAVAGSNLSVTPSVVTTLAVGATVAPVWTNASHITSDAVGGSRAFGYWVANAQDASGNYLISGVDQTVVWIGDSWAAQAVIEFEAELDSRLGATTVVDVGVSGNTLAQMLARWDTDVVPHGPDFVVVEYGVNDIYNSVATSTFAAELEDVVSRCRAIGAVPILTGIVPLADYVAISATRAAQLLRWTSSPAFPAMGNVSGRSHLITVPNSTSIGLGEDVHLATPTGIENTAVGWNAQRSLTTGLGNVSLGSKALYSLTTGQKNMAIGRESMYPAISASFNVGVGDATLRQLTTGQGNVAIGLSALTSLTTANYNTAIGMYAGLSVTGANNTGIGYGALYSPAGVAANATTTATGQTAVGYNSGQGSATQVNNLTAIGYQAVGAGAAATAIGASSSSGGAGSLAVGASSSAAGVAACAIGRYTSASANGSAAIGRDSAGTGASSTTQDEIGLGTALHTTRIAGWLRVDRSQSTVGAAGAASALPATPSKFFIVKDSAGTEFVVPAYAKA